jgi:DNA-binding MarR family transcriptional regulator
MKPAFDELIHPPNRLRICALLASAESVEFSALRDMLEVSDSVLSKQVKVLKDAGYVESTRRTRDAQGQTSLQLTARGRSALDGHLAELRRIATIATAG